MATNVSRPLPLPDIDSRPFWQGAKDGKLLIQRCPSCRSFRWPPRDFCNVCYTPGGDWTQVSGQGILLSWTVQHHLLHPGFADEVPYVVLAVALDEDRRCQLLGNLRRATAEELQAGMAMEAVFEEASPEITLVHWRPRRG